MGKTGWSRLQKLVEPWTFFFFSLSHGSFCWSHSPMIHFSHWPQDSDVKKIELLSSRSHLKNPKEDFAFLAWIIRPSFWPGGQALLPYDKEKGWADKSRRCPLQFTAVAAHVYTDTGPWKSGFRTVFSGYCGHRNIRSGSSPCKYSRFLHLCSVLRASWVLS